jgi:hypothetical protein
MSEQRDGRIAAFVDGELSPEEARAFEAELARDPKLAAEAARQAGLRERIAAAYAPVLEEPVPPQLMAAALAANDRGQDRTSGRWVAWAATAASLAVGLMIGRTVLPPSGPLAAADGRLVARGALARSLETALASDTGNVRIGLTVRADNGRWCRTFQSSADRLSGLACRDGEGSWLVHTVAAWAPPGGAYRTAGAETPPQILAALETISPGEAADAVAERAARDSRWAAGATLPPRMR